jgi:CRISPR-associated endonuclease/helicase Cas3
MPVIQEFVEGFCGLTGHVPMRWQCRLFEKFIRDEIPQALYIPTGLGKTSVIVIWLLALAHQARSKQVQLPRRLIYVVNRRTVVDQATSVVDRMRQRLSDSKTPEWNQYSKTLQDLYTALRSLCAFEDLMPLGISTLRGELADNEEWKIDPARPAVIIGTVDMVGSKLLFRGYGDARYWRPHHAGLIGQDALLVHDEAHLTPAFSEVLRRVTDEQKRSQERRPLRVMELSATLRSNADDCFRLEPEDENDQETGVVVKQRLDAEKKLRLDRNPSSDLTRAIVRKAQSYFQRPSRVLIYLRSPEDAKKVADTLLKLLSRNSNSSDQQVALLTGTLRGHEKERLVSGDRVFRAFLDHNSKAQGSMFLIATSAGEVGVDIDADHMICDLTTLDSIIQRLGRVNRSGGEGRVAFVDVVWTANDDADKAVRNTLALLRKWLDKKGEANELLVSPRNIQRLIEEESPEARQEAFSPKAVIVPLTDVLLDGWSMTSIDTMPGRPNVAEYLHGLTADPPETFVAWRKEVLLFEDLQSAKGFEDTLSDWFCACRIEAQERLRDTTGRVRKRLKALLDAHRGTDPNIDFPVVLLDERGRASRSTLDKITQSPQGDARDLLAYRTVVLPVQAGGLDRNGMLSEEVGSHAPSDVAETDGQRARKVLCEDDEGFWLVEIEDVGARSGTINKANEEQERGTPERRQFNSPEDAASAFARERGFVVSRLIALSELDDDREEPRGVVRYLVLMVRPEASLLDDPERARSVQTLDEHTNLITRYARQIAEALELPQALQKALVCAARYHDRGKNRPVWQRFARNDNGREPLAKSRSYLHGRALGGYRHEFGSLLEAREKEDVDPAERDLVLHLVAAHHGWARPHFEHRAFDHQGAVDPVTGSRQVPTTAANEDAAIETMQRFARLQQHFGRWGLAWLESLLRCADIAASRAPANPEQPVADAGEAPAQGVRP